MVILEKDRRGGGRGGLLTHKLWRTASLRSAPQATRHNQFMLLYIIRTLWTQYVTIIVYRNIPQSIASSCLTYLLVCLGYFHSTRALTCTVIPFVSINAKFGICTVVGLNGTIVEAKIRTWNTRMCVPFRPRMVQMPNLLLIIWKGLQCGSSPLRKDCVTKWILFWKPNQYFCNSAGILNFLVVKA